MDRFKEQLVKTKDLSKYKASKILAFILLAIGLIFMMVGIPLLSLIVFLGGFIIFYCKKFLYTEYEYSITNGDVDIDVIYEAKVRRNVLQFNMREVEVLAPLEECNNKNLVKSIQNKIKAIPYSNEDKIYCAIVNLNKQKTLVEFVPDREFLDLCFMYNPKSVKR